RVLDANTAQQRAGRPGRREVPDRVHRERPLGQQPAHHAADLPGGADHPDPHRPVPPYTTASSSAEPSSNASWTARTAASRSVSRQTTEMRISDVEIISTLTPASA